MSSHVKNLRNIGVGLSRLNVEGDDEGICDAVDLDKVLAIVLPAAGRLELLERENRRLRKALKLIKDEGGLVALGPRRDGVWASVVAGEALRPSTQPHAQSQVRKRRRK